MISWRSSESTKYPCLPGSSGCSSYPLILWVLFRSFLWINWAENLEGYMNVSIRSFNQWYLCSNVEQANTQLELKMNISEITNSNGPIFSARRNVSPQIRSSTIQGIRRHSCAVIQRHTGIAFSYVNMIHPEVPVVWGTLKVLRQVSGIDRLKTSRELGVHA